MNHLPITNSHDRTESITYRLGILTNPNPSLSGGLVRIPSLKVIDLVGTEASRSATTLSSKVNLHLAINFGSFCGANLATYRADVRGKNSAQPIVQRGDFEWIA